MAFWTKKERAKAKEVSSISEDELRLVSEWYTKFLHAKNAKEPLVKMWKDCISAYKGDYFKNQSIPDYKSDLITNYIFATIETIKPVMVDNNPKFVAMPRTQNGMEVAPKVQMAFDYEWNGSKMGVLLPQALTTALQIGSIVFSPVWDAKMSKLGEVRPLLINPFNLYVDPLATNFDDAEYVIYAKYMHVNKLKLMFPKKAELLVAEGINHEELVPEGDISDVKNQVLVLEIWCRDYTTIEVEEEDENGNKLKKKEMKYPNGRVLTITQSLLLNDKPNPYEDGRLPFVMMKAYDVPFEFWGRGEAEQLLSTQKYILELSNQIIDNAKHTANMQWIIDKNAGIEKGALTNRPGLVIRKNPGTEVRRDAPPPMPSYVGDMIAKLKDDINTISGVHDSIQGKKEGSVTAASAILALQEASQARIRLKVKLMELSLGELAQMWYSRMRQFWITERWVRVTDANYSPRFVSINKDDLQEDMDIVVTSGSTMPLNKSAMFDLMIRLAQTPAEDGMPMVGRNEVLQFAPIPNKQEVIDRFTNQQQMQQQLQQMQQQLEQLSVQNQELQQQLQSADQEKIKSQTEIEKLNLQHQHRMKEMMVQNELQKEQIASTSDVPEEEVSNEEKLDKLIEYLLQLNADELAQVLSEYPELEQLINDAQGDTISVTGQTDFFQNSEQPTI